MVVPKYQHLEFRENPRGWLTDSEWTAYRRKLLFSDDSPVKSTHQGFLVSFIATGLKDLKPNLGDQMQTQLNLVVIIENLPAQNRKPILYNQSKHKCFCQDSGTVELMPKENSTVLRHTPIH